MNDQELETALRDLGHGVRVEPVPADLAERVLTRVPERRQHPVRRFLRRLVIDVRARRRLIAMIVAALIAGLLLASPVRAAVIEWLRVGGVVFRSGPEPSSPATTVPPGRPGQPTMIEVADVDQARTMIDFPIGLPTELGRPTRVAVSEDRRLVELEFQTSKGKIALSEFDGSMIVFVKRNWEKLTQLRVRGELAVWLPEPHTISYVDPAGVEHTDEARLSGPSLAFEAVPDGGRTVTVRLEGPLDQDRAVAIAESLRFP